MFSNEPTAAAVQVIEQDPAMRNLPDADKYRLAQAQTTADASAQLLTFLDALTPIQRGFDYDAKVRLYNSWRAKQGR